MNRLYAVAALAALCLAGPAGAQSLARAPQPSVLDRPSEAVRRADRAARAPLPAATRSVGEAKALMAVGAASIVVGALIGGDGGAVLMFGGALVGLYGLWNYLR